MIGFLSRLWTLIAALAAALGREAAAIAGVVVSAWSRFWFTPADPLPLGVIRAGTGLVLVWLILATTPLLPAFYGPDAWVDQETANALRLETPHLPPPEAWEPPPEPPVFHPELRGDPASQQYAARWGLHPAHVHSRGVPLFSPFFHLKSPLGIYGFHCLALLVAVLFLLGLGGRLTCVLAWAVALCYLHRVQAALFGMDTILAVLLLYLAIGPSTARLSLDRRLGLAAPPAATESSGVALRLMQVHFAFIYLASGLSKLQGEAWWRGTALWQALSNGEFTPRVALYWDMLRLLTQDRLTYEVFNSVGGSVFTLLLEIGLPFLIWLPRWRPVCVIGAVMLHVGIALTMGLTSFSVLMILLLASFIPPEAWKKGIRRRDEG